MAEKFAEVGKALEAIGEAVIILNLNKKNGDRLAKVTDQVNKNAVEVEKINTPGLPKLDELKKVLKEVRDSGAKLEVWFKNFIKELLVFEAFINKKIKGQSTIKNEVISQFCEKLKNMHDMSTSFSNTFEVFAQNLGTAEQKAADLKKEAEEKAKATDEEASSKRNWGIAQILGLTAGGAAVAALGFFTGGVGWTFAGAIGGAALSVGAVKVGHNAALEVKEMRKLASGILSGAEKLGPLANRLRSCSDQLEVIKLDKKALEHLQTAIEFIRRDLDKDERIAQQQAEIDEKEAENRELREQLRRMGHG